MNSLQEKGYGVTIYFEDNSLKKKMSYANKLGIENVVLVGEEEVIKNQVKIRNMRLGNEIIISYEELYEI